MRLPRALTTKRNELATERKRLLAGVEVPAQGLHDRMRQIEGELQALDFALKLISPDWTPPDVSGRRAPRKTLIPRGDLSRLCLLLLRECGSLTTRQLAIQVAEKRQLHLDRRLYQSLANAVATRMGRYQERGLVEARPAQARSRAVAWSIRGVTAPADPDLADKPGRFTAHGTKSSQRSARSARVGNDPSHPILDPAVLPPSR